MGLVAAALLTAWAGAVLRGSPGPRAIAQRRERAAASVWWSREACLAAPRPRRAQGTVRIATWNIRWFPDGAADRADHPTDVEWLACAIASLRVDAIALQEIVLHARGRRALDELIAALDRRTGGRWDSRADGCPDDHQHLVVLVDRSRARIDRVETTSALHPAGDACAQHLRPGLAVSLTFDGGLDLTMITAHLDSGASPRDHGNRRTSMAALGRALAPSLAWDRDVVLLGDLNTMGCRECAPPSDAAAEIGALDTELAAAGLVRVAPAEGCSEYAGSHPSLLDHVAVTRDTAELAPSARVELGGACALLGCRHAPRDPRPAALEHLSDHCPLVIELEDVDRDP